MDNVQFFDDDVAQTATVREHRSGKPTVYGALVLSERHVK